jgi:hypothetical protein
MVIKTLPYSIDTRIIFLLCVDRLIFIRIILNEDVADILPAAHMKNNHLEVTFISRDDLNNLIHSLSAGHYRNNIRPSS